MSTNNPFEKLNIKRDPDDEENGEFEKVKAKEKNAPLGIATRKKKIRPKEKVENEPEEGFEEVKNFHKKRPENNEEEEEKGHKKRRGINYNTYEERDYRENQKPPRGRRYDRQSGTGRGREIAKGGAGGKYTWNDNPEKIARDFENNDDDEYFEAALNPDNNERKGRRPRREYKDEKDEENEEDNKEKEGEEKEEKEGEEKEKEEKEDSEDSEDSKSVKSNKSGSKKSNLSDEEGEGHKDGNESD